MSIVSCCVSDATLPAKNILAMVYDWTLVVNGSLLFEDELQLLISMLLLKRGGGGGGGKQH